MGDYDTLAREIIEAGGLKALIRTAIEEAQEDAKPEPEPEPEPVAVEPQEAGATTELDLDAFETMHDFHNVEYLNFESGRVRADVCLQVQGSYVDAQVDVDPDEMEIEPDYVTVHLRVSDVLDILQSMQGPSRTHLGGLSRVTTEAERRAFVAAVAAALSTRLGL